MGKTFRFEDEGRMRARERMNRKSGAHKQGRVRKRYDVTDYAEDENEEADLFFYLERGPAEDDSPWQELSARVEAGEDEIPPASLTKSLLP